MKIFKFGGASVSNSNNINCIKNILSLHSKENLIVIVSAMGKTTNSLEFLVDCFVNCDLDKMRTTFLEIKNYHNLITEELFDRTIESISKANLLFNQLEEYLKREPSENFDFDYDQIVSFGELISTAIISEYLNINSFYNNWADARYLIRTDNNFREGNVNWEKTERKINHYANNIFQFSDIKIILTQGFIGATNEYATTTLGREGSDYTAAIFAYSLNAEQVTIWKDVSGVLNADPKYFPEAIKLDKISYREAIELAYYGATIIHPKTIKPLQNKSIPLFVKSFIDYQNEGSLISNSDNKNTIPTYIFKREQNLISISPKDFSFIAEENLSLIFGLFAHFNTKINLMQNSAISFSVCIDNNKNSFLPLIEELKTEFNVKYNQDLELITIRNYKQDIIDKIVGNRKIFTEQRNRITVQLVVKSN